MSNTSDPMSRRLREMTSLAPDALLLTLTNERHFNLEKYLGRERMNSQDIAALAAALSGAFQCASMRSQKGRLVPQLVASTYLHKHLYAAINELWPSPNGAHTYNIPLIRHTMNILSAIFEINPGSIHRMEALIERLENLIKLRLKLPELVDEFQVKISDLIEHKTKMLERECLAASVRSARPSRDDADDLREPPNDFTEMSIVPSLDDLIGTSNDTVRPFLRRNITNGAYRSVHHYLDVQFRLLREDFLNPLRAGVFKLQEIVKKIKAGIIYN